MSLHCRLFYPRSFVVILLGCFGWCYCFELSILDYLLSGLVNFGIALLLDEFVLWLISG